MEVFDNGFGRVWPTSVRRNTTWKCSAGQISGESIKWQGKEQKHEQLADLYAPPEFIFQQINFVEQQDDVCIAEERMGDDVLKQTDRVLHAVHIGVLVEILVESGDWCEEDDGVGTVEEWHPSMTLCQRTVGCRQVDVEETGASFVPIRHWALVSGL